jgi:hypothetical protein
MLYLAASDRENVNNYAVKRTVYYIIKIKVAQILKEPLG